MRVEEKEKPRKKPGAGLYFKLLVFVCLIVLALFLAPWIWILLGLWVVFWLVKKVRK